MKKWWIPVIALLLLALIGGAIFLCVRFFSIAKDAAAPVQADVLAYAEETYPQYDCSYDGGVLTLRNTLTLTYEQACSIGGSIYTGELAPETYLSAVQAIALDISARCGQAVNVALVQESSDGQPVFTVGSNGQITVCWE